MRLLVEAPRWLFLGILLLAPWAYGCTRPWTIEALKLLMAGIFVLWLAGCLARRSWPRIPWLCLLPAAFLLGQGWWMTWNAHAVLVLADSQLTLLSPHWPAAPGSIEHDLSRSSMERITGLLGMLCFTCDLAFRPVWRQRLWLTMALTGVSVVILGLVQHLDHAPMIFWEPPSSGSTFFGTYFYRGNAGAFLNLILPLLAGFAIVSSETRPGSDGALPSNSGNTRSRNVATAFWLSAIAITVAGVFTNRSRAAQAISLGLLIVLAGWHWFSTPRRRGRERHPMAVRFAMVLIVLLPVVLIGWDSTSERWASFSENSPLDNGRMMMSKVTARMLPDAGFLGFGPGTFRIGMPFYFTEKEAAENAGSFWRYAHNDYLQTIAEWGWGGAAAWGILFATGFLTALRYSLGVPARSRRADHILLFTSALALLGIAIHAIVDFPLQIASLQLYTATLLGISAASSRWVRSLERAEG